MTFLEITLLIIIFYYLFSFSYSEGIKNTFELLFVATLLPIFVVYCKIFKIKK